MTRHRHTHHHYRGRPPRRLSGWLVLVAVLLLPLWLTFWAGRAIHRRWGMRGLWIYLGALIIAAALQPVLAPTPPAQPAPSPVVVITVTTTVTP
jgi:hypothetical protein